MSMSETLESLAFFSSMTILGVVTRHEIIQITPLERIFLEREMHIRPQIINPQPVVPKLLHKRCGLLMIIPVSRLAAPKRLRRRKLLNQLLRITHFRILFSLFFQPSTTRAV